MKVMTRSLPVAMLAVLNAAPALAADWAVAGGSVREVGYPSAAVAVPAPMPIPEYKPNWYFRFDAAVGMVNNPSFSENGFVYGASDGPGPIAGPADEMGMLSSWFSTDFNTMLTAGAGVGYYIGGGWRVDATIEKRSKDDAYAVGENEWNSYSYDAGGNYVETDTNTNGIADTRSHISVNDTSRIDGTVWMLNAYYDFAGHNRGGLTPYVGAGIGFVWNEVSRSHSSTTSWCDNEAAAPLGCAGGVYTQVARTTATDRGDTVSLAASLMAGFSYDVSEITAIDVGYRYLYLAGTTVPMDIAGMESRLSFGDQSVHQLRAGLRFNVN